MTSTARASLDPPNVAVEHAYRTDFARPQVVIPLLTHAEEPCISRHLDRVDQVLAAEISELCDQWSQLAPGDEVADVLGADDLPRLLDGLLRSGGKRIRPVLAYLGWWCATDQPHDAGYVEVVRASAALELLHAFALVHDDVMDESSSRRGAPTTHVRAAAHHTDVGGHGSAARFGDNIAILLGDLAHAAADGIAAELPTELRRLWRLLVVELVYGQRRDLTGSAAGRTDLRHAREVARLKSGAYTIERPLQLGATAAHAPEPVLAALTAYGTEVGEAFALRDDLLGVWGDPARTGKPAGDDLISGKPTVILALAQRRVTGSARTILDRVGTANLTLDDIGCLQQALADSGVVTEVEDRISRHVARGLAALDEPVLNRQGVRQLIALTHSIAWRDA